MKLIILQKVVLGPNGPGVYNKEKGKVYPIISTPANYTYPEYPGFSWVDLDCSESHLRDKHPSWLPFKQKKIL